MIRKYITHYYRDKYILHKIYEGLRGKFAINKTPFIYMNGAQVWVLVILRQLRNFFWIDIIKERNANNIEKFIKKFVPSNNLIITDGWSEYSWLERQNSNYNHIVHSHSAGD